MSREVTLANATKIIRAKFPALTGGQLAKFASVIADRPAFSSSIYDPHITEYELECAIYTAVREHPSLTRPVPSAAQVVQYRIAEGERRLGSLMEPDQKLTIHREVLAMDDDGRLNAVPADASLSAETTRPAAEAPTPMPARKPAYMMDADELDAEIVKRYGPLHTMPASKRREYGEAIVAASLPKRIETRARDLLKLRGDAATAVEKMNAFREQKAADAAAKGRR